MTQKKSSLEKIIIEFLEHYPDTYVPVELMASALKMDNARDYKKLTKVVGKMTTRQMLKQNSSGHVKPAINESNAGIQEGEIAVNRHGIGFVRLDGFDDDIRIPRKKMGVALPGDIVRIKITGKTGPNNRVEGRVLEIRKRGNRLFVGTLIREKSGACYIEPDEKSASTSFFVLPENTMDAKHNEKVIFRLIDWINPRTLPEARVVDRLGQKNTNDASILSILAENQIVSTFPDAVDEFARKIATTIPAAEYKRRLDLRDEVIFTIDPVDAKDFDDALSIRLLENGNYQLGVHIADVTHYMQPDTLLDKEALERGTSVYLVDRVIPMLPESLSNGVCSLRPNEDKLCYSCFMEIDHNGKVHDYEIRETVINSRHRFTYEAAQEVIDGKKHPFSEQMLLLQKLASRLTQLRFEHGAMDFDTPEPRFVLDEHGKPVDIVVKKRLDAHRLVEECMLMANKTVAIHIENLRSQAASGRKKKTKDLYPFFYRIHDKPDPQKLANVAENVGPIGIKFKPDAKKLSSRAINDLLKEVQGHILQNTINELVLRSMAKAVYSPQNIGHFGLSFEHYAHFTSPIRRYPDVIVHRLLKNYAAGVPGYTFSELESLGTHCSNREKMAVNAERDSIKLKQVEYMSSRIGNVYDGFISGVTEKGLFVSLKEVFCEGLVHISDLNDDYYVYDPNRHILYGRSNKKSYRLGDEITVKVFSTNIEQRTIDFVLSQGVKKNAK
ncbi:MAG: ribonuclease R [Bacteroidetes bacterium HLUCCA01]|nr:MAG: ribonuclease R [Bacteroidetes bacterium HLUCCA01]